MQNSGLVDQDQKISFPGQAAADRTAAVWGPSPSGDGRRGLYYGTMAGTYLLPLERAALLVGSTEPTRTPSRVRGVS
jgi:hypothetical protein